MITTYRKGACIYAMLAALEDAKAASNAPLDAVETSFVALHDAFIADPDSVTETAILDAADMLWAFLTHSFTNIRRFFRDMERPAVSAEPAADGQTIADGSASAL